MPFTMRVIFQPICPSLKRIRAKNPSHRYTSARPCLLAQEREGSGSERTQVMRSSTDSGSTQDPSRKRRTSNLKIFRVGSSPARISGYHSARHFLSSDFAPRGMSSSRDLVSTRPEREERNRANLSGTPYILAAVWQKACLQTQCRRQELPSCWLIFLLGKRCRLSRRPKQSSTTTERKTNNWLHQSLGLGVAPWGLSRPTYFLRTSFETS